MNHIGLGILYSHNHDVLQRDLRVSNILCISDNSNPIDLIREELKGLKWREVCHFGCGKH
ncbi:hypothetical protein KC19_4G198900 [Ceratodon purpureus]|uniref:Protein kinase domain-containing protein n=1 Tax=Ceratodon purpureus TaxID=3225 RepID=A0A8T0IAR2_CERPU|nr:hypothetical protein KC19_4G198900 [Ceratodon purpureus]